MTSQSSSSPEGGASSGQDLACSSTPSVTTYVRATIARARRCMAARGIEPDKGWSWVILVSAFLCHVIFDGIIFSYGVFYLEFLDHFQEGHGRTSWIGSIISGVYAIIGPLVSVMANKFGCRAVTMAGSLIAATGFILSTFSPNIGFMIATYSLMGGVGFGMMYLCAYVMIGHFFDRYRALATGIASCGSGVGTFIFAPLSVSLIDYFGWKGALWIIAGFILNGIVFGMTYQPLPESSRPDPNPLSEEPPKERALLDLSLFKNPSFIIFCFSSFLCLIGFFVPFIYLPDYARKQGISKEQGAFLISIIGITNTIGRVMCGYVSDKPWADPLKIYNVALIIGGAATIVCSWLNSYALLATYSAIFGFAIAAYVSLCAIILIEFMGLERLSDSFGFLNMFRGIATFVGAPVAGFLFDMTGDYEVAFYVAGAAILLAGIICLPLRVFRRCIRTQESSDTTLTEDELALVSRSMGRNKEEKTLQQTSPAIKHTLTNEQIHSKPTHTPPDEIVDNREWAI